MKKILTLSLSTLLLLASCNTKTEESSKEELPSESNTVELSSSSNEVISSEETSTEEESTVQTKYQVVDGEVVIDDVANIQATNDNYRVFYEIFTGSFSDSNGDGVGDLKGIMNRLDYLNDGDDASGRSLGVEGLWLTPIFKSPTYHKYDVADYYTIDPQIGSTNDLIDLVTECHKRNIKVIIDLPINHTSNKCQWYQEFAAAHRGGDIDNQYYDFYSWYDSDTGNAPSGRRFNQLSGTNHYYECNFDGAMPELNFDNEDVRQAVLDIAYYYLDLGIDGFRFDAAMYVYYGDNPKSQEFWSWYIDKLKEKKEDIYTVAEVWAADTITNVYYPSQNCFNFTTSGSEGKITACAKGTNAYQYATYVQSYLQKIKSLNSEAMMVPFVSNHDMDRAAGFLPLSYNYMQMAANLYILNSGSPFIYYGEEIGMKGSRGSDNTDANRRLAMLWDDGDKVKNPTGSTYSKASQKNGTVATQIGDENSLLNYYKRLIMIRKAHPEIARGSYTAISIGSIGGFKATYNDSTVVVIHNTSFEEVSFDINSISAANVSVLADYIGMNEASLEDGILTIGAQTSVVLK